MFSLTAILFIFGSWALAINGNAQSSAALLNAKKDAEAKGYIFAASHDEIVNRARKEGRLNVVVSLSQDILTPVNAASAGQARISAPPRPAVMDSVDRFMFFLLLMW